MTNLRLRLGLLLTALTLLLTACPGGGGAPNAAPSADDGTINLAVGVTTGTLDLATLISDDETAKDDLELSITTDPENGDATIAGTVVTYTLDTGSTATTDSFIYTVTDGDKTATGTVNVTIAANTDPDPDMNNAPVASTGTIELGADETTGTLDLSTVASDPEGDTLTFTVENGSSGTAAVAGSVVTYTLTDTDAITDTFEYTVSDGELTATGTVTVSVEGEEEEEEQEGLADDDTFATYAGVTTSFNVTSNDDLEDDAEFTITSDDVAVLASDPDITVAVNYDEANKLFTVTPGVRADLVEDDTYPATFTFSYSITSGGETDDATVTLNAVENYATSAADAAAGELVILSGDAGDVVLKEGQALLGRGGVQVDKDTQLTYSFEGTDPATLTSLTLASGSSVGNGITVTGAITGTGLTNLVRLSDLTAGSVSLEGAAASEAQLVRVTVTSSNDGPAVSLKGLADVELGNVTVNNLGAGERGIEFIDVINGRMFNTNVTAAATADADTVGVYVVNENIAAMSVNPSINTVDFSAATAGVNPTGFFATITEANTAGTLNFVGDQNTVNNTSEEKEVELVCPSPRTRFTGAFFIGTSGEAEATNYGCSITNGQEQ